MATFPVLDKMTSLPFDINDGTRVTRAADGTNHIARLYDQAQYKFILGFVYLLAADYELLVDFYDDNKYDSAIEFTDPNTARQYLVQMLSPPKVTDHSGIFYTISMELEGVRA